MAEEIQPKEQTQQLAPKANFQSRLNFKLD
jgi:hypothetical protein